MFHCIVYLFVSFDLLFVVQTKLNELLTTVNGFLQAHSTNYSPTNKEGAMSLGKLRNNILSTVGSLKSLELRHKMKY